MPEKPKTHMEHYEEDALSEALREIIEICKDFEQRKNQLSLAYDFSIHDLFAMFDLDQKGYFNFREFQEVYDLLKIYPSRDHLRLAFINMDKDLDQKVTLKEFMVAITPVDKNYKDLMMSRRSYNEGTNYSRASPFTPDTMRQVVGLLRAIPETEANLERVRENTRLRPNFNYEDAFKSLDTKNSGFIRLEQLSEMFINRYMFYTNTEIQFLIDRFDKTSSGMISLNEFVRELRPKLILG